MRTRTWLICREAYLKRLTGDDFLNEALSLIDDYRRNHLRMAQVTVRLLERRGVTVPDDVRPLSRQEQEMLDHREDNETRWAGQRGLM